LTSKFILILIFKFVSVIASLLSNKHYVVIELDCLRNGHIHFCTKSEKAPTNESKILTPYRMNARA